MTNSLPAWTRNLDNAFLDTWVDIQADAADNILLATPITALLKEKGCFKSQEGSEYITRTIRYGVGVTTANVSKGDTLPLGVVETETMARWTFRNKVSNVQRDTITDAENAGANKIQDYVKRRLGEARDSIAQNMETAFLNATTILEDGKDWQGLNDVVPLYADSYNATLGANTYGGINRPLTYAQIAATNGVYKPATGNTWWGPAYKQLTAPYEQNLVSDMKVLYNSIFNNQEAPNYLVSSQDLFELYEEFALDKSQLVKDDAGMLVDLGFETLRFKGKPWSWTPNIAASNILFLNFNYVEVVYRSNLWFEMTEWKQIPNQMERVAHIICAANIITRQPRRHGRLTSATVS